MTLLIAVEQATELAKHEALYAKDLNFGINEVVTICSIIISALVVFFGLKIKITKVETENKTQIAGLQTANRIEIEGLREANRIEIEGLREKNRLEIEGLQKQLEVQLQAIKSSVAGFNDFLGARITEFVNSNSADHGEIKNNVAEIFRELKAMSVKIAELPGKIPKQP